MIRILALSGLATVQDAGRPGRMHQGIPPGGALVPELLALANAAARNDPREAAVEVFGAITLEATAPVFVAADGEAGRWLHPGEPWSMATAGARVRYLAVRGGIEVPTVLGGRGTLVSAGFGGHEGRPLRRGDVLRSGEAAADLPGSEAQDSLRAQEPLGAGRVHPRLLDPGAAIRVVPGPDLERFAADALAVLLASPFRVASQSDRVGARLLGAALPRADDDAALSGPMVRGAIQVPLAGDPIVLGPDHPTTGGYPVLATVIRADVGALMARAPGATVRFSLDRHGQPPDSIDRPRSLSPHEDAHTKTRKSE